MSNIFKSGSGSSDLTQVTGALGVTNAGTGLTGYAAGDLIYASSASSLQRLAVGTTNQVLTSTGGLPSWATPTGVNAVGTASPSNALTISISGLNGNTDKLWRVSIDGLWGGADAILMGIRPNNDTGNNYYGSRWFYYSGVPVSSTWASLNQMEIARKGYDHLNSIHIDVYLKAAVGTSLSRTMWCKSSWSAVGQPDAGFQDTGGVWNNVSTNITSLMFDFGGGTFTGTINVYPQPI